MKFYLRLIAVASLLCVFGASVTAQQTALPAAVSLRFDAPFAGAPKKGEDPKTLIVYSHGDPTDEEQLMLEYINRARMNPAAEGQRIANAPESDVQQMFGYPNTQSKQDMVAEFNTIAAKPPLAFNAQLMASANGHCEDMLANNFQGHTGSNGSTMSERIIAAGYKNFQGLGENVFCYTRNVWHGHCGFQIDIGNNPTNGHRRNIMSTGPEYTEIGIRLLHGGSGTSGNVGPILTTQNFGYKPFSMFLLGVVYDDVNANGFYDIGEGIPGVTITLSTGEYSAVTSASGGYAIPVAAGTVVVTAQGGEFGSAVTKQVNIVDANVKVDFTIDRSGLPGQIILVKPVGDTIIGSETALLQWRKDAEATKYHLQFAANSEFTSPIINNQNVAADDTTMMTGILTDKARYFWRVRASNSEGWGAWSAAGSFEVKFPMLPVVYISPSDSENVGANADVTLKWRHSKPVAQDYWLTIAKDIDFDDQIFSETMFDTSVVMPAGAFIPNRTYYWNVAARDDESNWIEGARWSFTTTTVGVEDGMAFDNSVTVSPNPTTGIAKIAFQMSATADVELSIFDASGARVGSIGMGKLSAGAHTFTWDGSAKAAGTYFYELHLGDRIETGKFLLVR